jgi:predicted nucleic acid-binding protein
MSAEPFTLDTNILVYAVDGNAGGRHVIAREVMRGSVWRNCRLTLQSVSEFYAAVTRKQIISRRKAAAQANDYLSIFPTIPASTTAVGAALTLSVAGRASYWDALLIATAAEAGCTAILTEDLADGTDLLDVRIVNPFAGDRLSPGAEALLGR